ncbi:sensor histidine kinase [Catenuloplanes japonicus]|uniref:sensor histidine kinase n=1 Tax=Catenuloplanes japonicus TaxID=33876 RepID=UPI000524B95F|nr:HAMP domain-containing sensor histidine kinase [Catenuloplanes japonicus]
MTRRLTLRVRLTLSYVGLIAGCALALTAVIYLFMRYVPDYQIAVISPPFVPTREIEPSGIGVARPASIAITTVADFLDVLMLASAVALVVFVAAGTAVGWIVAGRIIKPLAAINAAATRAATGALDHRLALGGPRDEIRDLSDTFDRMLASLERSFAAHRRFAANASHELRTPLATTKTMLDVALDDPETDATTLRTLASRLSEVNRASIETVNALLDLADAETGTAAREPVDLAALANHAIGELTAEATAAGVTIRGPAGAAGGGALAGGATVNGAFAGDVTAGGTTAVGDPVLLRQAVSNLVRNAVRHNHAGGEVTVRLAATRLTVINTGPPVAPESVATLTEPFTRGAGRALTRGAGHGLGLAIVSAVATAHDATLTLRPNRAGGGLTVHLDLPPGPTAEGSGASRP